MRLMLSGRGMRREPRLHWLRVWRRFVSRSSAASLLSSEWMLRAAAANSTLLEYLYPRQPRFEPSTALTSSWQPLTLGCAPVLPHPFGPSCWCFHVSGSMRKDVNPQGASSCVLVDQQERRRPAHVQLAVKRCACERHGS
mmetsp:Transcript_14857/g.33993  ORF Transcript_14857/g.33993 Transcript_14857/m.33993 type:complete len:140 (-) Transcript_14857:1998-2417(-)